MYRRIYLLFGISILAVVTEHAITWGINALYFWMPRYQSYLPQNYDPFNTPQYFIFMFLKQLLIFGVPAFFFASGYFVSYAIDKNKGNIQRSTINARILSLIPPFLIWTTVANLFDAGIGHIATPIYYIGEYLFGIYGFWFVPALIMFYLLSPWFVSLAKKNWKQLLLFSGLIQVVFIILEYTLLLSIQSENPIVLFLKK